MKEAFIKVGGFDESMSGPEDWDIDKKIKQIGKIGLLNHVGANCNSPDWELSGFIKERGVDPKDYGTVIYHNEDEFNIKKYLFIDSIYRGRYPAEAGLLPLGDTSGPDAKRALGIATNTYASVQTFLKC